MIAVGVLGASGYTGTELLRLLGRHPHFEVKIATAATAAYASVAEYAPSLAGDYPRLEFEKNDLVLAEGCDVVFSALPHGASQTMAEELLGGEFVLIDLSADFRLKDPLEYERWYGHSHKAPQHLGRFVYGLPERHRDALARAAAVAVPGCYPTAATLALAPLLDNGVIEREGIVVNAASGVTGAGRAPKPNTTFGAVNENFTAYGLLDHRHTPEMEQAIGASLLFTPHLAPMSRGILATCYARSAGEVGTEDLLSIYLKSYEGEPFLNVTRDPPGTKHTLGSNSAHVSARCDQRTGWVLALCAIDNLGKGAAGQAIQCANIVCGLEETAGLATSGVFS